MDNSLDLARSRGNLTDVASALQVEAETRKVAERLERVGIGVLRLKGPGLKLLLYGNAASYPSSDVDLLIPRQRGRTARRLLVADGWEFDAENGLLWRLSRAASYKRGGITVDLHWGLHAAHLPAWALRNLE